ncbi:MAG TPA: Stk1 family PASTA domain-containing Ser/Thr kinase [Solirubrobacteraceae bacterium]|jgi:serine/threonine-protein kinase|nr:Stk1 family PASTA domain-containing Ser/Thr kinase [Solirubrobacteraceae bacterium]
MAELEPGTIVDGRYRVMSRLGSGGMADVFCAEDQQLGRKVALKLLHRRFAEDPGFVERFRREAQAAAGLQHPNVVSVYDRGSHDDTYYIVMEYLPGRTLKQLIRDEAPLDPVRAIDITIQILKAARFAHRRGVIHRDLKPHNVMVEDDSDHIKVTDFGIARAGASDMTETGSIMGTAQYLSPEQAQGHAVSASSDLYSVGVVLYEMLTGRVPFDAESAVTIALKHVSEAPVPPTQINPNVPPELEQVVLWALNKDPVHRPADDDQLITALEQAKQVIVSGTRGQRTASFAAVGGAPPPLPPPPPARSAAPPEVVPAAFVEDPPPPPMVTGPQRPARSGGSPWPWILLVALLIGAGIAAYLLTRPAQVKVPLVVGSQVNVATTKINDAGLTPNTVTEPNKLASGTVVSQNPLAGQSVDKGSTIRVVVSSGPGNAPVPSVVGKTKSGAEHAITGAGLKVGSAETKYSSSIPAGRATGTDPPAGQSEPVGYPVTLFVSLGPAPVNVPDVTGETATNARNTLTGLGLKVTTTNQSSSTQTPGTVISQSRTGSSPAGSTVNLVLAQAPPMVKVPTVTGATAAAATKTLKAAGFAVKETTTNVTDPTQDKTVVSESPAAGSKAKQGATVTIVVGKYTTTTTTTSTPTGTTSTPTSTTTTP